MHERRLPILDAASALADPTRCRILQLLDRHELTVSELCSALQLPQSTVSRHLKVLGTGGWLRSRRDGTSHFYRLDAESLDGGSARLWRLVREQIADEPALAQDRHRLDSVLAQRRSRSREFFSTAAGEWDRLRDELFGTRFDLLAALDLLDPAWTVGDLACGTGRFAEAVAPAVKRVVALDGSEAMLAAARVRLAPLANVDLREGELERLPLDDGTLDAAVLILALHYVADPPRVLAEAHRVLAPGGRLLVVDMMPHDREDLRREMGHAWLGFSGEQVAGFLREAGFEAVRHRPLPAAADARGPALFVASARRSSAGAPVSTNPSPEGDRR